MRRASVIGVLAAACIVVPAHGQSSDGTIQIATLQHPGPIAAYGQDTFAWSSYDPQTRRFRLEVALRGTTRTANVPSRGVPFDVDLGPGPDGRPLVVYSRCAAEAPRGTTIPDYTRGRGCDIYTYDPATDREQKELTASRSGTDEVLPSIYGSRIAFVRDRVPFVRSSDFGAGDQRRRGPRGAVPTGQDLRGSQLATAYRTSEGHEIRLTGSDGQDRLVARARATSSALRPLVSPSFDRGILFFRSSDRYWAFRPASASTSSARVNRNIAWMVHASGQTFSVVGAAGRRGVVCSPVCDFVAERPLRFEITAPLR
jgi:hypothetical protein